MNNILFSFACSCKSGASGFGANNYICQRKIITLKLLAWTKL